MSAAWAAQDSGSKSSVARHEWKGLAKMSGRLEDYVEKQRAEAQEGAKRPRRSLRLQSQQLPGGGNAGNVHS